VCIGGTLHVRCVAVMADTAALERSPFALLPHGVFVKVLLLLPVDARAACATVCKNWRSTLAERTLWTRLDLSLDGSDVEAEVTDALLRGAAAKARGGLTALDVSGCLHITHEALLEVVTANAGALTELRACRGLERVISAEQIEALLGAAPQLREFHADVRWASSVVACRMLRNEPPFGPLRLHLLSVQQWPGGEADVRGLAADVTASASSLSHLLLLNAPLAGRGVLDAVVDAALARRLPHLALGLPRWSVACVPALARLLGGSALHTLCLHGSGAPLLLSGVDGSVALLAAALRANHTLARLVMPRANVWHDAAAAETLLGALTAHPSLQCLHLDRNHVRGADRARAGALLGELVAANAPALEKLVVADCALGDEGLGPLVDALAANTHLQELDCANNAMSDAFALHWLLPAVRANASLRKLRLVADGADLPGLRELEQLVAERGASRDAAAGAQ
jgi:hypothetical protein